MASQHCAVRQQTRQASEGLCGVTCTFTLHAQTMIHNRTLLHSVCLYTDRMYTNECTDRGEGFLLLKLCKDGVVHWVSLSDMSCSLTADFCLCLTAPDQELAIEIWIFRLSTAQTISTCFGTLIHKLHCSAMIMNPLSSDCPQQNGSWCRQHHMYSACQAQGRPAHTDDGANDTLMPQEAAVGLTLLAVGQQHKLRAIFTELTTDSLF